jgi:predicted NBD/HSP70 family sugar kinase
MAQLAAVLDPGMFVLGGGVSAAGELLREPAWRALLQYGSLPFSSDLSYGRRAR